MTNTEIEYYFRPSSVEEALTYSNKYSGDVAFLAGGTDYMVNHFQGNETRKCIIDLSFIPELKEIKISENILSVGSMVTLDEICMNQLVLEHFPALAEAAEVVGNSLIRKTATIGGNLLCENRCSFYNQSDFWRDSIGHCLKSNGDICIATGGTKACFSRFVSDTAPVLISLCAKVKLIRKNGIAEMPVEKLYTNEGVRPIAIDRADLILSIEIPIQPSITKFRKLRTRESLDFSSLSISVSKYPDGKIIVAMNGIDPGPLRIEGTVEKDLTEFIKKSLKLSRIVENDIFSRKYRREMVKQFLQQTWKEFES